MSRWIGIVLAILGLGAWVRAESAQAIAVLLVGNSVSGTVSVIDVATSKSLGAVNVIPDLAERLKEIEADPARRVVYRELKKQQIIKYEPAGAGGDRFVDDVFLSPDGTTLYVSRSNLADVAAFDLTSPGFPMRWRTKISSIKSDHAALSPDGSRIVVSEGSLEDAQVLETSSGKIVGSFKTGNFAHQNDYSPDGHRIYNSSIGRVSLPYAMRAFKGPFYLTVADAETLRVIRRYSFDAGIRPNVMNGDESVLYAQLSYLNGVIKYDLKRGREIARIADPLNTATQKRYPGPDDYPHNSAHHGLSLSGDGKTLCDAGTIDNTVTLRSAGDLSARAVLPVGSIPYWATTSHDGESCYVSLSGDDKIAKIDFREARVVARIPVGRFPQRSRIGWLRADSLALLNGRH